MRPATASGCYIGLQHVNGWSGTCRMFRASNDSRCCCCCRCCCGGGREDELCSLRKRVFITVAWSLTRSYCFCMRPALTNLLVKLSTNVCNLPHKHQYNKNQNITTIVQCFQHGLPLGWVGERYFGVQHVHCSRVVVHVFQSRQDSIKGTSESGFPETIQLQ